LISIKAKEIYNRDMRSWSTTDGEEEAPLLNRTGLGTLLISGPFINFLLHNHFITKKI
jgi:hypothetical protein